MSSIEPIQDLIRRELISMEDARAMVRGECLPYWQRYWLLRQLYLWEGRTPTESELHAQASSPGPCIPPPAVIGELTDSEKRALLRQLTLALGSLEGSLLARTIWESQKRDEEGE